MSEQQDYYSVFKSENWKPIKGIRTIKLEDLTDEELETYFRVMRSVNNQLCNGERHCFIPNLTNDNIIELVKHEFENENWNVKLSIEFLNQKYFTFTSALEKWTAQSARDNYGTHKERYLSQTRVPESHSAS